MCIKAANKIPWRDLNSGEDVERLAHFVYLGFYLCLKKFNNKNQSVNGLREKRYAKGFKFYYRQFYTAIDAFRSRFTGQNYYKKHYDYLLYIIYFISKFCTKYFYDNKLNNLEFINKNNKLK